jgi:hypothetical protein
MPVLDNHRRELFTQLLFQGFPAVDAYEKAGYKRELGFDILTTATGQGIIIK